MPEGLGSRQLLGISIYSVITKLWFVKRYILISFSYFPKKNAQKMLFVSFLIWVYHALTQQLCLKWPFIKLPFIVIVPGLFVLPSKAFYVLCKYQFGCGILKMVGPKKQDFWPKINILKGNKLYFENTGSSSLSKIGHDLRK